MPEGQVIQQETDQADECLDGDCPNRTYGMMRWRAFKVWSCDAVRDSIKDEPIVDAWGAQARVVCNAASAEAISAGNDGKIGTCDDIIGLIAVNPDRMIR